MIWTATGSMVSRQSASLYKQVVRRLGKAQIRWIYHNVIAACTLHQKSLLTIESAAQIAGILKKEYYTVLYRYPILRTWLS
jgi:hypothetical protein